MKKRIGIEINGVLRDTIGKIIQTYQKYMIDRTDGIEDNNDFIYKMELPVNSLELKNHFTFKDDEELYNFLYQDFSMEIFGHAQSSEYYTFNDLQNIYLNLRDEHDICIVSDEIGKSKPASLFFLSKFGCQVEKIKFYSNITKKSMWNEIDILLTANPFLLLEYPDDKIVIKFETDYNKDINISNTITKLSEFEEVIKKILK
jgi:hypothetical protein